MQRNPLTKQANQNVSLTPTKKGPGRRHVEIAHGAAPIPSKDGHFLGQHTNPEKNQRRRLKASLGARKLRIMTKLARRAAVEGGPQ